MNNIGAHMKCRRASITPAALRLCAAGQARAGTETGTRAGTETGTRPRPGTGAGAPAQDHLQRPDVGSDQDEQDDATRSRAGQRVHG